MSIKSIFFENDDHESKGYRGEKLVFDSVKIFFKDRECIAKHGYVMNFQGKRFTIEADVLLADKEFGINIFEVKGIRIDNILSISMDGWLCEGIYKDRINPVYQVDRTATDLLDFLKDYSQYTNGIGVKSIIVLPYITSSQWKTHGFDKYAFLPPIIFKDDIEDKKRFFNKLNLIPYKCTAKRAIEDEEFTDMKTILFGDTINNPIDCKIISEEELLQKLIGN